MSKVIETTDILRKIYKVTGNDENKLEKIALVVKNKKTGEIKGINYKYVADEILFLFVSDNIKNKSLSHYLKELEYEAMDGCWNDHVEIPEGYVHPDEISDDAEDVLTLSEEEMQEGRYNYVTSMLTRVYIGDEKDCPIANYSKTFEFNGIEVLADAIVLTY